MSDAMTVARRQIESLQDGELPAHSISVASTSSARHSGAIPVPRRCPFLSFSVCFCPHGWSDRPAHEICVNMRKSLEFRWCFRWWPQRDSNPCFSHVTFSPARS